MSSESLPPPPADMDVDVDHDGICWRFGRRPDVAAGAGLVLAASGLGALTLGLVWGSVAALIALAALLVLIQALRSTSVRLTSRALTLVTQGPFGTLRQDVRIDDVLEATCARSARGDLALVLRARETMVIGSRESEEALAWMRLAVEYARRRNADREAEEGREWVFLRRTPEEIARLRAGDDDRR